MLKCLHGILFSCIFELQTKANEMKAFNLTPEKPSTKINKSRLFKRAHWLTKNYWKELSLSEALKIVWAEIKSFQAEAQRKFESECIKIKSLYNVSEDWNVTLMSVLGTKYTKQ